MQLITTLKKNTPTFILGLSTLFFVACGAHQESDYRDNDGIYNNDSQVATETTDDTSKDSYYKQYFNSKTDSYEDLPEEGAIFTDIEAYHTTETINKDGDIIIEEVVEDEYAGWGENSDNVIVNVYGGGGNWGFWNRPYWWYGAGWGFSNYWCGPYYGIGYGWGYPYYGNYGWGYPIYHGGYYNNYYNPYYGNAYNGYAYTRGRRSSDYYDGRTASRTRNYNGIRSNRDVAESGRSNNANDRYSRSSRSNTARSARTSTYRPNSRSTRTRPNTSTSRSRPNTTSRNSRTTRPRATTPRTTRPSVQSRSNSSRSRSNTSRSSSPRRSSSTRSSRGGGRSSGASRGGGSRGRGGRGI